MFFNQNFYNNFHGNTFQNAPEFLPPPPLPPAYFIPPQVPWDPNAKDANFVKQFESKLPITQHTKPKILSISAVRDEVYHLLNKLKELKSKESMLSENVKELSDEQWNSNMKEIEDNKTTINKILLKINSLNLEVLQKQVMKRSTKRARLKRLRSERKREKEEWLKQMQEKSRSIDEKLQKIHDDIQKAKQEEEAKTQADIVLKETLRKKHDAKKFIVKLDALIKLRRARQNTAKGRGESVLEAEGETFSNNIEKLKTLWRQRLCIYEKEEATLRAKLEDNSEDIQLLDTQREGMDLAKWRECLFGGGIPQVDFAGDVAKFVSIRCHWDEFVTRDGDGSSLPVGWVPPSLLGEFVQQHDIM